MPVAAATIFSIGRMVDSVLVIRFFWGDMNELRDLAGQVYYGNTLRDWAIALAIFALLFTVLPLLRAVIRNRLRKPRPHQSRATLEIVVAVIDRTTRLFLLAVAIWLSTRSLTIPVTARPRARRRAAGDRLVPGRALGHDHRRPPRARRAAATAPRPRATPA